MFADMFQNNKTMGNPYGTLPMTDFGGGQNPYSSIPPGFRGSKGGWSGLLGESGMIPGLLGQTSGGKEEKSGFQGLLAMLLPMMFKSQMGSQMGKQ
jgi:hypothetical protein